ncbi:hypothetical protein, partial [Acinetobacter baumannii]
FKAGDWVKTQGHIGLMVIYKVTGEKAIVDVISRTGKSIGLSGYKLSEIEHASEAEIKAGHRIDGSVDQVFKDAFEHGHGFAMVSIEGVEHASITHVINPFPCEELGDDFPIESHISPLCKSKDV